VETIAENDDEILHKFLEGETITPAELKKSLRKSTIDLKVFPVLVGTSFKNKGVQPLLDAVVDYLPSPLDIPVITGLNPDNGEKHPILLESITFAVPVISVAVEPKTKADQEKMSLALNKLSQEDPTFKVHTDPDSGQTIISGMGELHLEIIVDRMMREYKVEA